MPKNDWDEQPDEIATWIGSAVTDIAQDQVRMWRDSGWDDSKGKVLDKMKADGVTDIEGCYADHLYDNADTLADLMGDRVCDVVGWEGPDRKAFVAELRKFRGDKAWQEACDRIDR